MKNLTYNQLLKENVHLKHLLNQLEIVAQQKQIDDIEKILASNNYKSTEKTDKDKMLVDDKTLTEILYNTGEKYCQIFQQTNDAIFLINKVGYHVDANPEAINLLGYTTDELKRMSYNEILDSPYQKESTEKIKGLLKGETYKSSEKTYITKSGNKIPVEMTFSPIKDIKGKTTYILCIARDINERKKADSIIKQKNEELQATEEELRASNDELNSINKILERQKEELKKAKEKAEENDRLKSAFLANMSHEIRTPMNSILGFSQLLKANLNPEKRKKYIRIIHQTGNQLLRLVNDIIDIAKIESGQLNIIYYKNDLNSICNNLFESYQKFSEENDKSHIELKLSYDLTPDQSIINGDGNRLHQILDNLLNNAMKFTKQGSIEFGAEIRDNVLFFFVKDTGIGIPERKKKMIFERFRQVDNSSTREYKGTGLGLTISKNLVELMNGKIWVESDMGEGTSFYFRIPYDPFHETVYVKTENIRNKSFNWKGKTILLVEDDPSSQCFMNEILADTKVKLKICSTGEEALQTFQKDQDTSLVLMDIRLPKENGLEVTRKIRKINSSVPIIVQTAHALNEYKKESIDAGATDYITKPIETKKLMELINKYI